VSEKPRVLLVEDDLFHRELLAEGLKDYYDYDVVVAENLERAEDRLREATPDLVILDCVLENNRFASMDWARRLRGTSALAETPILFVTAYYREMGDRAKEIPRSAILPKPFTFEDVTRKMRELLTGKV
jgi:DNA-binding response OmpR family regulator